MTPEEWNACTEPGRLFLAARYQLNGCLARLVACGCARLVWVWLSPATQVAVETAERFIAGEANADELLGVHARALEDLSILEGEAGQSWASADVTAAYANRAALAASRPEPEAPEEFVKSMDLMASAVRASKHFASTQEADEAYCGHQRAQCDVIRQVLVRTGG